MNDCPSGVLMTALKESRACRVRSTGDCRRALSGGRDCGIASSHHRFGSNRRRPIPRQQLFEPRARPPLGHLVDDAGQIGMRVETIQFGRFDDRINLKTAVEMVSPKARGFTP